MARAYLAALREAQPEGPYLLGGWSFGGLVAFEMGQQLLAQDQEVAVLALLDTSAAPAADARANGSLMKSFAESLGLSATLSRATSEAFWRLDRDEQLAHVLEHARRSGMLAPDLELPDLRRQLSVFAANLRAATRYQPARYAGRVTLLTASEGGPANVTNAARWDGLVPGGVDHRAVPGSHHTMLRAPHVEEVARQLAGALEAADVVLG
jgi:thioesterase domain-containing protein